MLAKRNSAIKKPGSRVSCLTFIMPLPPSSKIFPNTWKILKNFSKVSNLEKYIFAMYPPYISRNGLFRAAYKRSVDKFCKSSLQTFQRTKIQDYNIKAWTWRLPRWTSKLSCDTKTSGPKQKKNHIRPYTFLTRLRQLVASIEKYLIPSFLRVRRSRLNQVITILARAVLLTSLSFQKNVSERERQTDRRTEHVAWLNKIGVIRKWLLELSHKKF